MRTRILNALEAVKKISFLYVFKNGSFLFSINVVSSLVAVLTAFAAAHYLSPTIYGTYKYIIALGSIATLFSLSGAGDVLLRSTARGEKYILKFFFSKSLIFGYLPSLILTAVSLYYFFKGNTTFAFAFFVILLLQPLFQAFNIYKQYLNGKQEYRSYALYSSAGNMAVGLCVVFGMYFFNSVSPLILIYFLANTLTAGAGYIFAYKKFEKDPDLSIFKNRESKKELLNYSIHLSLMKVTGKIAINLDTILAFHMLGPAQLAIYTFARIPVDQIRGQRKTISSLIAPRISKYSLKTIQASIHAKAAILFFSMIVISVLYIVSAPFIFAKIFPIYTSATFYSQIMSLSLLGIPSVLYQEALKAQKQTKFLYILNTVQPILKIILLFILIPIFNILGLAIALVIPRIINFVLSVFLFQKIQTRHHGLNFVSKNRI